MSWNVESLHIYPIKSCQGIDLQTMEIDASGPKNDRVWMVTDSNGVFLTQRTMKKLALVRVRIQGRNLECSTEGFSPVVVDPDVRGVELQTKVWQDSVPAVSAGPIVDQWFSDLLKKKCHLVRMTGERRREKPGVSFTVGYADGYPFLLANKASLADLNKRLDDPVLMNRFRPNIVVKGPAAYAEDTWRSVRIGNMSFPHLKPCARCVITTIDQGTGKRGEEPLATLRTYRIVDGDIMFGQNLVHEKPGIIRVGDEIHGSN